MSEKKLKDKHIQFCEEYVANGFNGAKAYASIYGASKKTSAVQAYKLLHRTDIQERVSVIEGTYQDLGRHVGLTKERILDKVKELLEAKKGIYFQGAKVSEEPDFAAINAGIEKFGKLTGAFMDKKSIVVSEEEGEVNLEKMTDEEKKELRDKILSEL